MKVIYHSPCTDGFCAAWLMHCAFPDAEFIGANYGQDPPDVTGEIVYIVDFSYPRQELLTLAENNTSVTVLDHHKTAKEELASVRHDRLRWIFSAEKSGGRLTWDYLHDRELLPEHLQRLNKPHWLVQYTEDRDLWRQPPALPNSKEINAALRCYPQDFKLWTNWSKDRLGAVIYRLEEEGRVVLMYRANLIEAHVKQARQVRFICEDRAYIAHAVNCTAGELISEVGEQLAMQEGADFGATWTDEGTYRRWSLRSRGDLDVSKIAKCYGGGGHKTAAGCRVLARVIEV